MSKMCAWIPQVKNNKGEITDSKLFKELAIFIKNRKDLVYNYTITKNPKFIEEVNPLLDLDDANEPTLKSLIETTDFINKLPEENILKYAYKSIESSPELVDNTYDNTLELQNKINVFNSNSMFKNSYIATLNSKDSKIYIDIKKKTKENSEEELKKASYSALNKRLRDILSSYGVSVGVLSDLEVQQKLEGITDFDALKNVTNGYVQLIRLAKGEIGEAALPEEFSHVIIEMLKDKTLINRLINNLDATNQIETILGDKYEFYNEAYKGDRAKLAKEAAGKLLAQHLVQQFEIPPAPYKNILQRAILFIKDFFKSWNPTLFQKAIIDSNKEFSELAKNILNQSIGDLNIKNISETGKFYSLEERLERDNKVVQTMIINLAKKINIKKAKSKDTVNSREEQKILLGLEEALENNTQINAIFNFLEYGLKEMQDLESKLNNANKIGNLNTRAQALLNIKNYLVSYNDILEILTKANTQEEKYADNRYGDKMLEYLKDMKFLQGKLLSRFEEEQLPIITDYVREFLGENTAKNIKISDSEIKRIFTEADKDISFLDMWLSSMSQTNNDTLKIIGKIFSDIQERKRLRVIDLSKKILAAGIKLEQEGIKDTSWMFNPNKNTYINKQQVNKLSKPQQEYWETFMALKHQLDKYLPAGKTEVTNSIKIRKDLLERIKDSKDPQSIYKELTESIRDAVLIQGDDTEYSTSLEITDFQGNMVQTLPLYYLNLKEGESSENISTDTTSSLIAYAEMAINYNEMGNSIGILELMRDQIKQINPQETKSGKPVVEKIKAAGKEIITTVNKKSAGSNLTKRIDVFFDMQIYQNYIKDYGDMTILGKTFNKTKLIQKLNGITSFSNMAFNYLSSVGNVANSEAMMRIEASGGEFYSHKNLSTADFIMAKNMPTLISNLGKRIKTDKFSLFAELFNVGNEYESRIKNIDFDKKSIFSKTLQLKNAFFLSGAGEFWAAMKNSLAMADNYRLLNSKGENVSLWESVETKYIDANNPSLGAKLIVKEGTTKLDGTSFTQEDLSIFTQKTNEIARYLYGNYDQESKNALQNTALGASAMMYKNWLVPALKRRYGKKQYNYLLDKETEGYYRTASKFLWQLITDLKASEFDYKARKGELEDYELANLRKAVTEMSIFATLTLLFSIIDMFDDDDDEENNWFLQMTEYTARRLKSELGTIMPTPALIDEAFRIYENPIAGIRTLKSLRDLLELLYPSNYEFIVGEDAIIQSGIYKGESKAYKIFMNTPGLSVFKQIEKVEDLAPSIRFYSK